jgi:hypothetical protein
MTWRVAVIAWGAAIFFLCVAARADSQERSERYLDRYRGPYQGRVVDAETKAPIGGAVVVASWTRDRVYPLGSVNERYAVREVVTDADGRFLMEVRDVEERAPKRTRHPGFAIFLPSYGSFPRYSVAPRGSIEGIFEGAGATVELPRLTTRRGRLENLDAVDPYTFSDDPFTEIPRLTQLFNQERSDLGLGPYPASGRRE